MHEFLNLRYVRTKRKVELCNYLFDGNADSNGIDGSFNLNFLLFITTDDQWSQEQLLTALNFNFWFVVTLHNLRLKVLQAHCSSQT